VKSVQLTENICIVSVEDSETKDKLIINGLTLQNRSISFLDVEKTITNVTIKDMPYEVQNCFVATQILRYGQVIPESVRRGYIKGHLIKVYCFFKLVYDHFVRYPFKECCTELYR
jgi:hypothetical protein